MKGAAAIFSESDLMEIELYLCANPSAGVVIPQGAGFASCAGRPRGTASGAARVSFTCFATRRG